MSKKLFLLATGFFVSSSILRADIFAAEVTSTSFHGVAEDIAEMCGTVSGLGKRKASVTIVRNCPGDEKPRTYTSLTDPQGNFCALLPGSIALASCVSVRGLEILGE